MIARALCSTTFLVGVIGCCVTLGCGSSDDATAPSEGDGTGHGGSTAGHGGASSAGAAGHLQGGVAGGHVGGAASAGSAGKSGGSAIQGGASGSSGHGAAGSAGTQPQGGSANVGGSSNAGGANAGGATSEGGAPGAGGGGQGGAPGSAGAAGALTTCTIPEGVVIPDASAVLPIGSDGFTQLPTDYALSIYVDAKTGNDANDGKSADKPLKTLDAANKVIDATASDVSLRVLLKRGSTWDSGNDGSLSPKRGGSADHPLVIDGWDYGDASAPRPVIHAFQAVSSNNVAPSHVAIVGVDFEPKKPGVGTGISYGGAGDDFLVEDTIVNAYWQSVIVGGYSGTQPLTNFRLRRSQVTNAYDAGFATTAESKPQGMYLSLIYGGLLEENLFDHNAYKNDDYSDGTEFGHDIYVSNSLEYCSFDLTFRGNLISRGLHSVKGPARGVFDGNLFYDDGFAGYMGVQGGAFVHNAVIDNSSKVVHQMMGQPTITQGGGFAIDGNMDAGPDRNGLVTVQDNLFLRGVGSPFSFGGALDANVLFDANVSVGWSQITEVQALPQKMTFSNNQFVQVAGSKYFWELKTYAADNFSFAGNTYDCPEGAGDKIFSVLGTGLDFADFETKVGEMGGTFAAPSYPNSKVDIPDIQTVLTATKAQAKGNWKDTYRVPTLINALRAGLGRASLPVGP